MDCPDLDQVFSELAFSPMTLAFEETEPVSLERQRSLFSSLQESLRRAEQQCSSEAFQGDEKILHELWKCRSQYMLPAAEILANGSRKAPWRILYGQAGVLDFFLQLVASTEIIDDDLIFHSLRLVGNSCADTNENREILIRNNYFSAIVRHLTNEKLIQVAIPVLYNICIEFEPAQSQLAANRIVYILLTLLRQNAFAKHQALLDYVYELIEMVGEQEQGIALSPDATILLILDLLNDEVAISSPAHFTSLVTCLGTYLSNKRFQTVCLSHDLVATLLSVLERSLSFKDDEFSKEDIHALAQARLKINQTLAEISALPLFAEIYPLDSPLVGRLKTWLTSMEGQLQICSCVVLGNLARSDAVCEEMVNKHDIHKALILLLKSEARGAVLHSALGFLKNLAIAGNNKLRLGEAGLIAAVSGLWQYETVPQVQFIAISITRQVIISSVGNIARLLEDAPGTEKEFGPERKTYFSMLLVLFEKTDSTPIKTEIGRTVASICRTLIPKVREKDAVAEDLLKRTFKLHVETPLPVGAMVTQSQWPVVRSEGWFTLALMASTQDGLAAVSKCIEKMSVLPVFEEVFATDPTDSTEAENMQLNKDCGNIIVFLQELLKGDQYILPDSLRSAVQGLMDRHASRHLQLTN
ncbi:putative GTP binding protein [Aspergillus homomorphus CBS 101889]|uniref:GTP-binding protein n=1 Tax=Aspergillus homomorphus (strain CBS 101889) TaxID=1450537 RepID=A0A395I1M1_ASPHC|nr:GTP-binding protein [Aspergillus homomorphus CBS 101889]RAL13635.1 GTP-binding protein [Aspergillus homomorphus CBS 101889]